MPVRVFKHHPLHFSFFIFIGSFRLLAFGSLRAILVQFERKGTGQACYKPLQLPGGGPEEEGESAILGKGGWQATDRRAFRKGGESREAQNKPSEVWVRM